MNAIIQYLLYVLSLVACSTAYSCRKICVLDDIDCVTTGAFIQYKILVAGMKGLTTPMDPMYIKCIDNKNGSMIYNLSNIELKGLKDCVLTKLMLNVTEGDYKSYLTCPKLVATFNYESNGTSYLGDDKINFTVCDYRILNTGQYGIFVAQEDLMPHFFIKSVLPKIYLKDNSTLLITRRLNAQADDIPEEIGEYLLSLIVKKSMRILFEGIDVLTRNRPMCVLLPGSNMKKSKKHCDKT